MTGGAGLVYLRWVRACAPCLLFALSCAAPVRAVPPAADTSPGDAPAAAARARLLQFVSAVEGARWPEAFSLLSARWRSRLTPSALARDLASAGPVGASALARVRALLDAGAALEARGREARLRVGVGKAALLLEEEGGYFVDAIE